MPSHDGEGHGPGGDDDELLAKVIPLRRRGGEPPSPPVLADEPAGAYDSPDVGGASGGWSIWDPLQGELNPPDRRPDAVRVLADEPGPAPDRSRPGEWSLWDPLPPPPPRRERAAAAHADAARGADSAVHGPASRRRLIAALAAATVFAAVGLVLALGSLHGGPGRASLRASFALHARRPSPAGSAKRPQPPTRSSRAKGAGARRTPPARRTERAVRRVPRVTSRGLGREGLVTVRYVAPAVQSPTPAALSSPAGEGASVSQESQVTASANREFGFER